MKSLLLALIALALVACSGESVTREPQLVERAPLVIGNKHFCAYGGAKQNGVLQCLTWTDADNAALSVAAYSATSRNQQWGVDSTPCGNSGWCNHQYLTATSITGVVRHVGWNGVNWVTVPNGQLGTVLTIGWLGIFANNPSLSWSGAMQVNGAAVTLGVPDTSSALRQWIGIGFTTALLDVEATNRTGLSQFITYSTPNSNGNNGQFGELNLNGDRCATTGLHTNCAWQVPVFTTAYGAYVVGLSQTRQDVVFGSVCSLCNANLWLGGYNTAAHPFGWYPIPLPGVGEDAFGITANFAPPGWGLYQAASGSFLGVDVEERATPYWDLGGQIGDYGAAPVYAQSP
jgi:hypothetical protein